MDTFEPTGLLLAALALPVVAFLLLRFAFHLRDRSAAAIAIVAGWALNIAWAFSVQGSAQGGDDVVIIAAALGWLCPAILVLLAWLVLRLAGLAPRNPPPA